MRASVHHPTSRRASAPPRRAVYVETALAVLPVLACFLGGATERWGQAIVFALLGLLLVIAPPRFSLGLFFNAVVVALTLCALAAFLPARWFMTPAWRVALLDDFGIGLASTVSPQPWLTLDCLVPFAAGLCWLYYVCARDSDLRTVRTEARVYAALLVLLAALCVGLYAAHTRLPFWHNERGFGPFPNRNQTGDVFGIGAVMILACAQEDFRRGHKRWLFWLAGGAIVIVALIVNYSRAGIVILLIGVAAWLGSLAFRKGSLGRLAVACSALLVLLTVMLMFGGQTLERFNLREGGSGVDISADFRWLIFSDAFQLIRASPWVGLGMGNFASVFAIFRDASLGQNRALHPESDWIWLWTEFGVIAVLLCLCGFVLLLKRVFPMSEGSNQRLRSAALIGAVLFALHALVDVPAHRIGSSFAGLFLAGLALHRPQRLARSRAIPLIFRISGLLLLAVSAVWIHATWQKSLLPGSIGVAHAKEAARFANHGHDFPTAIATTTKALEWAPLDWELYFLRAIAEAASNKSPSAALADFRRARFLEPNAYEVAFTEGRIWLPTNPALALTAWREALRRAGAKREEAYSFMLGTAANVNPSVRVAMEAWTAGQPALALVYMEGLLPVDRFNEFLQRFRTETSDFTTLTPDQKEKLFSIWAKWGKIEELAREVELHPVWLDFAWREVAKFRASQKDFRAAFQLTRAHVTPPELPSIRNSVSLDQLQKNFYSHPDDYSAGFALAHEQLAQGKTDDALGTIRHFTQARDCPAYFHFLEAEGWAARGDWERAWTAWQSFEAGAKKP